jgi:hypothetical protein
MNEGCVRAKFAFSIKNKAPADLKSSARQENGVTHPLGLPALAAAGEFERQTWSVKGQDPSRCERLCRN